MNDLEHRLMRALAETRRPADEQFVDNVVQRVDAVESVRNLSLVILTVAALCLGGALCFGISLSLNASRGGLATLATVLPTATPLLTMALVAIGALFVLRRGHVQE